MDLEKLISESERLIGTNDRLCKANMELLGELRRVRTVVVGTGIILLAMMLTCTAAAVLTMSYGGAHNTMTVLENQKLIKETVLSLHHWAEGSAERAEKRRDEAVEHIERHIDQTLDRRLPPPAGPLKEDFYDLNRW